MATQDERIEALRSLVERLGSPELTLTEAKGLRGQLFDLLGSGDRPSGEGRPGSATVPVASPGAGDSGVAHPERLTANP